MGARKPAFGDTRSRMCSQGVEPAVWTCIRLGGCARLVCDFAEALQVLD